MLLQAPQSESIRNESMPMQRKCMSGILPKNCGTIYIKGIQISSENGMQMHRCWFGGCGSSIFEKNLLEVFC